MKRKLMQFLSISLALLVLFYFSLVFGRVGRVQSLEGARILEDAVRRIALTCYSSEGFYPPSLDYMCQNYGLIIDHQRYIVHYELTVSNLMPDISVFEKQT